MKAPRPRLAMTALLLGVALISTGAASAATSAAQPQPQSTKKDANELLRANAKSGIASLEAWKKEQATKKARGETTCFSPTGTCAQSSLKKPASSPKTGD